MAKGGARPGAGRKVSSTTTRTREVAERLAKDGGLTPLEYVISVMRDENAEKADRLEAAKSALQYFHPRMPTLLEHSGPDGGPLIVEIVRFANSNSG